MGLSSRLTGELVLLILRTWMDWVVRAWTHERVRVLSVSASSWRNAYHEQHGRFNAYSIIKLFYFSSTFLERFSGLGEDLVFNYVSPTSDTYNK